MRERIALEWFRYCLDKGCIPTFVLKDYKALRENLVGGLLLDKSMRSVKPESVEFKVNKHLKPKLKNVLLKGYGIDAFELGVFSQDTRRGERIIECRLKIDGMDGVLPLFLICHSDLSKERKVSISVNAWVGYLEHRVLGYKEVADILEERILDILGDMGYKKTPLKRLIGRLLRGTGSVYKTLDVVVDEIRKKIGDRGELGVDYGKG